MAIGGPLGFCGTTGGTTGDGVVLRLIDTDVLIVLGLIAAPLLPREVKLVKLIGLKVELFPLGLRIPPQCVFIEVEGEELLEFEDTPEEAELPERLEIGSQPLASRAVEPQQVHLSEEKDQRPRWYCRSVVSPEVGLAHEFNLAATPVANYETKPLRTITICII